MEGGGEKEMAEFWLIFFFVFVFLFFLFCFFVCFFRTFQGLKDCHVLFSSRLTLERKEK